MRLEVDLKMMNRQRISYGVQIGFCAIWKQRFDSILYSTENMIYDTNIKNANKRHDWTPRPRVLASALVWLAIVTE